MSNSTLGAIASLFKYIKPRVPMLARTGARLYPGAVRLCDFEQWDWGTNTDLLHWCGLNAGFEEVHLAIEASMRAQTPARIGAPVAAENSFANPHLGRPRLDGLTTLRFFAAFHVILFHLKVQGILTGGPWWYLLHSFAIQRAFDTTTRLPHGVRVMICILVAIGASLSAYILIEEPARRLMRPKLRT